MLIIATTNQLDAIEKSIRRGGRIDLSIRLDMPTDQDRFLIFEEHLRQFPHSIPSDPDLLMIARVSSGFVSSDIAQIVRNTHLRAIKNNREQIEK